MKIYNLMISDGRGWSSSRVFHDHDEAIDYVQNLELGQREIEGDALKHLFHYDITDVVHPPFHAEGKRIYCSYAWTEFKGGSGCTWRAVYEQEI